MHACNPVYIHVVYTHENIVNEFFKKEELKEKEKRNYNDILYVPFSFNERKSLSKWLLNKLCLFEINFSGPPLENSNFSNSHRKIPNFTTLYWNFSLNRTTTRRVVIRPTERSSIGLPPCGPHTKSIERLGTIDSWARGSSTTTDPVRSITDEWATLNRTEWNYDLFIVRVKARCNSCKGVGSGEDLT